ncbi:MAG: hypothetical protein HYT76_01070 [Deltaproteobacteria bacterium]|nr:hypothetical protein [Deltaproteobacteria bacterium]
MILFQFFFDEAMQPPSQNAKHYQRDEDQQEGWPAVNSGAAQVSHTKGTSPKLFA